MPRNFKSCDREQSVLMPESLADWLPEGHLAWFIVDAVAQMDLSPIEKKYRADGWGASAYQPSMMVSLLLYAYCMGERSSRKIEALCETDVAFRVVSGNVKPDHATIARFRSDNLAELDGLFVEILRLCALAGLAKVGLVALDGTKIKANAALAANRTSEGLRKELDKEVKRMLSEAEAKDAEEDRKYGSKRGDELPDDLRTRKTRLERIRECKERLAREAAERAAEQQRKIDERAAKEAETGEKIRGRKPAAPDATPDENAKANVTDPESRVMKDSKGFVQGYNAQAVVTPDQIVVAADVTQDANDKKQLPAMVEKAAETLKAAGVEEKIGTGVTDAGYYGEAAVEETKAKGVDVLSATTKGWKERKALREAPPPRGRIPRHLGPRERMERRLLTKRGRAVYRMRGKTVEPVFGQMKDGRGCDRFLLRGLAGARGEWKLVCGTHNLLKLWRSGRANWN